MASEKKSRNPFVPWWLRAGTYAPAAWERQPESDTPEFIVEWLNSAKRTRLERIEGYIRRLRGGDRPFPTPRTFGVEELKVAAYIDELWDWGALDRLRRCKYCDKTWFFAEHANYYFCSKECREAFHRGTEAAKERTKLRMRKYRERLQEMAWEKTARKVKP
jgi:YHS domain-containing protein